MDAAADTSGRSVFFDNLRSLMVILVLIFHSGASYGTAVEFWPFHDNNPGKGIDLFMFLGDVFMMAVLFFVAGYFALPDLQKKGTWRFITGKLKRLGLPWLIITVIVLPVLDYIHYFARHANQVIPVRNFWDHWMLSMKKISEFHTGWMDMSAYRDMTERFYQRYMWFISLLLLFFIVFALLYGIKTYLDEKTGLKNISRAASGKNVFKSLLITAALTIILFSIVRFLIYPEFMGFGWFSLGNIIQFQFGKLIIYVCCFGLGVYAYSGKWFTDRPDFGKAWIWALICFCLFGLNMLVLKNLKSTDTPLLSIKIAFTVLYPLWSLSFLGFFVSWAYRHWNHPTRFNENLAKNSYNMYLIHYVFPFVLPLLLKYLQVPAIVKFSILSVLTIIFSYVISEYVFRRILKNFIKFN